MTDQTGQVTGPNAPRLVAPPTHCTHCTTIMCSLTGTPGGHGPKLLVCDSTTAGVAESQATGAYKFGQPSARNPTSLRVLLRPHSSHATHPLRAPGMVDIGGTKRTVVAIISRPPWPSYTDKASMTCHCPDCRMVSAGLLGRISSFRGASHRSQNDGEANDHPDIVWVPRHVHTSAWPGGVVQARRAEFSTHIGK